MGCKRGGRKWCVRGERERVGCERMGRVGKGSGCEWGEGVGVRE